MRQCFQPERREPAGGQLAGDRVDIFFSVGAGLDVELLMEVLLPTLFLAAALIAIKPPTFALSLRMQREPTATGWEVGYRLGQMSEFSLLLFQLHLLLLNLLPQCHFLLALCLQVPLRLNELLLQLNSLRCRGCGCHRCVALSLL